MNGIPFDTEKPTVTSGVRLGSPAATTRGFGTTRSPETGRLMVKVLDGLAAHPDDNQASNRGPGRGGATVSQGPRLRDGLVGAIAHRRADAAAAPACRFDQSGSYDRQSNVAFSR